MTDVHPNVEPASQPHSNIPRIRYAIYAGYLISLEDGARWASTLWHNPNYPLTAEIRKSPTVLSVLDKDVQKRGGIGVEFNTFDPRDRSTCRYLIVTQSIHGMWLNESSESTEVERVRDINLQLEEGDVDRNTLAHLEKNGLKSLGFASYFY